jgi:hypothetical protein
MATYQKYNDFVEQLCRAKHDFGSHVFKVALSNGTPNPAHAQLSDITELATGGGYTAGGVVATIGISETGGTVTITAADPAAWTASGSGITFRYASLYNDTSPTDALVAYWDNVSSTTVTAGNVLAVDFAATLFALA